MTREDIIRMARETGLVDNDFEPSEWCVHEYMAFAALVASAEREACANVCESIAKDMTDLAQWGAIQCANSIRKRVQK